MRRTTLAAISIATLLCQLAPTATFAERGDRNERGEHEKRNHSGEVIPGQYIVVLNDDVQPEDVSSEHRVNAKSHMKNVIKAFSADLSDDEVAELKRDKRVKAIEPDIIVEMAAQTLPTGINRAEADLAPTAAINGVDAPRVNADIAIIDTGIQSNHPDLNVVGGYNCVPAGRKVDSAKWQDNNGHGTHVAGTAAAIDNGNGAVGMAPGARLWSVKVLDAQGSGQLSWIICGIDWVTSKASTIETANMSLGGTFTSAAFDSAITRSVNAGVVYAVAAGNSAADSATFSPANHPLVIAVSAIADFNGIAGGGAAATCRSDVDDTFADFSNFGSVVDIAAPGVCIYSTWLGGGYNTISGTSMASPHITGAAALYLATHAKPMNAAAVAAVKSALIGSATAQTAVGGFSGDPDAFPEPLLKVTGY